MRRCPHCGFLNFDISIMCGRCEEDLADAPNILSSHVSVQADNAASNTVAPVHLDRRAAEVAESAAPPAAPTAAPPSNAANTINRQTSEAKVFMVPPPIPAPPPPVPPPPPEPAAALLASQPERSDTDLHDMLFDSPPESDPGQQIALDQAAASSQQADTDASLLVEKPPQTPVSTGPVTLAPLKQRGLAWLVDSGLTLAVAIVLTLFHIGSSPAGFAALSSNFEGFDWFIDALWSSGASFVFGAGGALLVAMLYQAICLVWAGRTLGHRIAGLSVVHVHLGTRPPWSRSVLRAVVATLGTVFFGLGHYWRIIDRFRRGWHDLAAGTIVVAIKGQRS